MDSLEKLTEHGKTLGYEGEDLRHFIREQQAFERDERNALREKEKDEREHQLQLEKVSLELKLKQMDIDFQTQMAKNKSEVQLPHGLYESKNQPKAPKIPPFEDGKDDMDSYLRRFERYATAMGWDRDNWATNLSALLRGKALDVYALMSPENALDYDELKAALLKRYDPTEDGFRRRFRSCKPETGETFGQFAVRLGSYCRRWLDMAKVDRTYESLYDLTLREQFLQVCNRELTLFLRERIPKTVVEMAELADQFREARFTSASTLTVKCSQSFSSSNTGVNRSASGLMASQDKLVSKSPVKGSFVPKSERRCYKCHKLGHIASECNPKNKVGGVTCEQKPRLCDRSTSPLPRRVKFNDRSNSEKTLPKFCGSCTVSQDTLTDTSPCDMTTILTTTCKAKLSMPVSAGYVEGKLVTVLRDTGCNGIVVRKSKIKETNLTGCTQKCILADGSSIDAPVAKICIDTPYIRGTFDAWCMDTPIYDLIVGNVPEVRDPCNPDPDWKQISAVETRQQARNKGKPYPKLNVPEIVREEIGPDDIKVAQENDRSLDKLREHANKGETITTKRGKVTWYIKNGLLYREFVSPTVENGKVFTQLVVPVQYRKTVMRLAHESIMSGHLATRRSVDRVLSEFYWPGVQADTRRFCQSCDICQRTVVKGKTSMVPLEKMPLIDEPFKRVAVDLIGPLKPVTDKGNRYILTLVDYATRYPEAIALPSIDTERVAEALVDIFSRIGIPEEMLTDMGSQFTSDLMSEVSRLLSLKQLTTTPYHPICNGLVERFNGTLKLMLKRMCSERPKV